MPVDYSLRVRDAAISNVIASAPAQPPHTAPTVNASQIIGSPTLHLFGSRR